MTDTYDPIQYEKMKDAFQILDMFLNEQDYIAGCNLTIADLALVASVTQAEVIILTFYKSKLIYSYFQGQNCYMLFVCLFLGVWIQFKRIHKYLHLGRKDESICTWISKS